MKRHSLRFTGLLFCLLNIAFSPEQAIAQNDLNVMSFNIRYNTPSDSLNAWPYRKDKVSSQVLFHKADILGIQEALHDQVLDLQAAFNHYGYIGVGRSDGKSGGEYSAIFYNTRRVKVLESSTFWLSTSPTIAGSKGWDANLPRIVTWAKMTDKNTNKIFYVFNTHFDHIGEVARRESAKLLLHAVDSIASATPAIIMGDFNAQPQQEPIQILTDKQNKMHFTDTKSVSQSGHYGPSGTFNAFGPAERDDHPIDYIFFTKTISVLQHATISQGWSGRFASDHFAVFVQLLLK